MVVNPPTPVSRMADVIGPHLPELALVLVMSVNPGWSGQRFMPEVLDKTRWARQRGGERLRVEMDGGINVETAGQAVGAGADVLVSASALFGASDRGAVIEALHGAKSQV